MYGSTALNKAGKGGNRDIFSNTCPTENFDERIIEIST